MGSWGGEDTQQGGICRARISHIYMHTNWEEKLGRKTDRATQYSSVGK